MRQTLFAVPLLAALAALAAPAAASPLLEDPCAALTPEEAAAFLGAPVSANRDDLDGQIACVWCLVASRARRDHAHRPPKRGRAQGQATRRDAAGGTGARNFFSFSAVATMREISGIGDEAFHVALNYGSSVEDRVLVALRTSTLTAIFHSPAGAADPAVSLAAIAASRY